MPHASNRRSQSGFGLLETLTGLIVFVILAMVGTKAFRGVVENQKEASQIKALTDAVTQTAEQLSVSSVATLTAAGSKYLQWSVPAPIGSGEYQFHYRTFPKPTIQGVADTSVVGLEVETGTVSKGVFTMGRSFATLISPHLTSKNGFGQVSTAQERSAEASHYAAMQQAIKDADMSDFTANQARLNSFNCYDQGQCCGYMKKYFSNPDTKSADGLDQKCNYRCALGGAVPMKDWKKSCGEDFCAIAPWKNQEQCCAAIAAGTCEPGSACAQVCIDCVGEDGTTCGPPVCDDGWWNDLFDCKNNTFCDGTPLPSGILPGWGNVQSLCKTETCAGVPAQCDSKTSTCCAQYWGNLAMGQPIDPKAEICKTISTQAECCSQPVVSWDWDPVYCGTDGKPISAHNKIDGKWYCGMNGYQWDQVCAQMKGCSSAVRPSGAPTTCPAFPGKPNTNPWMDTYPKPVVPTSTPPAAKPPATPPGKSIDYTAPPRIPSTRGGSIFGNVGGRE